jgi:hypothetical protein
MSLNNRLFSEGSNLDVWFVKYFPAVARVHGDTLHDAQMLLAQTAAGTHVAVIPLATTAARCSLRGSGNGT